MILLNWCAWLLIASFGPPSSLCATEYISLLSPGLSCLGSHCSVKTLDKKLIEQPFLLNRRLISLFIFSLLTTNVALLLHFPEMKTYFQFGQRPLPRKIHHMVLQGHLVLLLCLALHNLTDFSLEAGFIHAPDWLCSNSQLLKPQTSLAPGHQFQTLTILPRGSCAEIRWCSLEERGASCPACWAVVASWDVPCCREDAEKRQGVDARLWLKMGFCPCCYFNSSFMNPA